MNFMGNLFSTLVLLSFFLLFSCNSKDDQENLKKGFSPADSLQQLISKYPDSLELQILLQEKNYSKGDTAIALKNLEALLKKYEKRSDLHNALAVIQLQMGDTNNAVGSLVNSLTINQLQPDIEFELSFIEAARGNSTALAIADKMMAQYADKEIQAKAHFTKGIYYANKTMFREAIKEFDAAIINNFTSIDAYVEKGILHYELGETGKSIDVLSKAAEIDKNNPDIFFWLGKCYKQRKQEDQALLYFGETLKLDPNYEAAKTAIQALNKN